MTREIALPNGMVTLVDDADHEWLSQTRWQYVNGYATHSKTNGERLYMHRLILKVADDMEVDHRNLIKLDNQRSNLRVVTRSQNLMNRPKCSRRCLSQFKGVRMRPAGRWGATIKLAGKHTWLGTFASELDAARAYDAAALKHFGEFARINFPQEAS